MPVGKKGIRHLDLDAIQYMSKSLGIYYERRQELNELVEDVIFAG